MIGKLRALPTRGRVVFTPIKGLYIFFAKKMLKSRKVNKSARKVCLIVRKSALRREAGVKI